MVSSRIPFRACKVKRELQQSFSTSLGATSSDGAPAQKRKKRKPQPEEEADKMIALTVGGILVHNAVSATRTTIAEEGEERQTTTMEAHAQLMVSVTSLSEGGAIAAAIDHLKGCDAKLRNVIEASQLPSFQTCTSPFGSLARCIVYQQLATNAAAAIHKRLLLLCGDESTFTPAAIAELPVVTLRGIGLSARKASYLHDLSRNFLEGGLSDAAIKLMEDEKLMSALTAVKGIGVWSVHMFMIFALHRPDVLPVGDLGVRKGFLKLYGLKNLPTPAEMERLSAPWRPYRSLGAWYMWRVIEAKSPVVTAE